MRRGSGGYLSYLLRLWRTSDEEQPAWRIMLQDLGDGRRQGFGNLAELLSFLESQTGLPASGSLVPEEHRGKGGT